MEVLLIPALAAIAGWFLNGWRLTRRFKAYDKLAVERQMQYQDWRTKVQEATMELRIHQRIMQARPGGPTAADLEEKGRLRVRIIEAIDPELLTDTDIKETA